MEKKRMLNSKKRAVCVAKARAYEGYKQRLYPTPQQS
jgi:hypothetical protein